MAIAGMHHRHGGRAFQRARQHHGMGQEGLAVWVTIITLTILGLTLLISMLDAQLRAARLAARLRRANSELRQLLHDNLTALPNRVMLDQQLSTQIKHATLYDQPFALMFMDLDGFKAVNDTGASRRRSFTGRRGGTAAHPAGSGHFAGAPRRR